MTMTSTSRPQQNIRLTLACTLSLTSGTGRLQSSESALAAQEINRTAQEIKKGLEFLMVAQSPANKALFADTNVTLVIEDDENDEEKVRYWYNRWTSEDHGDQTWVYLSPYRTELADVAAGIVSKSGSTILLPFGTLPIQMDQQIPTRIISTAVPPAAYLKESLDLLYEEGARTISFIKDSEGYLREICDEGVQYAKKKRFDVKHNSFSEDTTRMIIEWMSADPDVIVMCVGEGDRVSLQMYFEGMKFEPKASVIVNSQNKDFVQTLDAPASINIIGPEIFRINQDLCNGLDCETFMSRTEFVRNFQEEYDSVPSYMTAQAVAAGFFATYAFIHTLREEACDCTFTDETQLSQEEAALVWGNLTKTTYSEALSTMVNANKFEDLHNFWHPFVFDDIKKGILAEPHAVTTSQLWKKKWEAGGGGETENEQRWKRFTELTPQRIGTETTQDSVENVSRVIFPRPAVREREAGIYPCDPGYRVNYQVFFAEKMNDTRNLSRVCQACPVGKYREVSANVCQDCPAGRQATEPGQSTCEQCKPQGNKCSAINATVVAAENYYLVSNAAETYLATCLFKQGGRCLGANRCAGNTEGLLCEGCQTGFAKNTYVSVTKPDPCELCSIAMRKDVGWSIAIVCIWALLILFIQALHWRSVLSLASTSSYFLRSFISYAQLTAITFDAFPLNIPGFRQYVYGFSALFLDTFRSLPNVCLLGSGWKDYKVQILASLGITPALLILCVLLASARVFLSRKGAHVDDDHTEATRTNHSLSHREQLKSHSEIFKHEIHIHHNMSVLLQGLYHKGWKPAGSARSEILGGLPRFQEFLTQIKEMVCFFGFLLYPMLLRNFTMPFPCTPVSPNHSVSDMDKTETCGSDSHKLWQMLGAIGLIVYGLGIPVIFFLFVNSTKHEQFNERNHRSAGFLYGGLRRKHSGLMIVSMLLKAALVLARLIKSQLGKVNVTLLLLCLYAVYISMADPYDARDRRSLAQLEEIMMVANIAYCIVSFFQRSDVSFLDVPDLFKNDVLAGIVLFSLHAWYLYWFLWCVLDASLMKWLADEGFHDASFDNRLNSWPMARWLYKRLIRSHARNIRFDPDTMSVDLSKLSSDERRVFKLTMLSLLSKYFRATMTDKIPWEEIELGKRNVENDPRERHETSKKKRRDVYMGFLSAGMRQTFLLIEMSRHAKEIARDSATGSSGGMWDKFVRKLQILSAMHHETPGDTPQQDGTISLADMLAKYGHAGMAVSAEEFYMATMLCWSDIKSGKKKFYEMKPSHAEKQQKNRQNTGTSQVVQWQLDESLDDFLEKLDDFDEEYEIKLQESLGDAVQGTGSRISYKVDQETEEEAPKTSFFVPLPSESSMPMKQPKLIGSSETTSSNQDEVLPDDVRVFIRSLGAHEEVQNDDIIETMGAQNALQVRKEQMEVQEQHEEILQKALDLQADIQGLERELAEAEAQLALKSSAQDKRKVDTAPVEAIEVLKRPDDPDSYALPSTRRQDFQSLPAPGTTSNQRDPGSSGDPVRASEQRANPRPEGPGSAMLSARLKLRGGPLVTPKQASSQQASILEPELDGPRGAVSEQPQASAPRHELESPGDAVSEQPQAAPVEHLLFGTFEPAEPGQGSITRGARDAAAPQVATASPAGEAPRT